MTNEKQSFFEWEDANPLLKQIPLNISFSSMGLLLAHDPKVLWEGEDVEAARLPRLIGRIRRLFIVTKIAVEFALQFFELLIEGLEARDPRISQNRSRIFDTGRFKGKRLSELPWFSDSAAGMVVEGITGVAKTFILKRVLSLIPQTCAHETSQEYGWQSFTQLIYLVVPMPSSSRQGAFLLDVALGMDRALGTKYADSLRSRDFSDDKRAVLVLHWLSVHRCGALIVEECQERNLPSSVFGSDFLSLFLRAMNWGIPVVVLGNPKALSTIKTFTQDGRRFSVGHWFTMEPVWDFRAAIWTKDLVPGIWGWSPMSGKDEHVPNRDHYLWKKTAGIPDFLVLLRKESLKNAARLGRDFVTMADIEEAYKGRAMQANHPLIEALISFDPRKLSVLTDVPADAIVRRWIKLGFVVLEQVATAEGAPPKSSASATSSAESAPGSVPAPQNALDTPVGPAGCKTPTRTRPPKRLAPPASSTAVNDEDAAGDMGQKAKSDSSKEAAPRGHEAPDQHIDRRSAAYRHLFTQRPKE